MEKIINYFISKLQITDLLLTRCSLRSFPVKFSTFYYDIITSWKMIRNCMNEISLNPHILTECMCFNNFICIKNKPSCSEWHENETMSLKDMINNDDSFFT